jgi:hypothetical protein
MNENMTIDQYRLGKEPYKHDPKTVKLGAFLGTLPKIPLTWDFEKTRMPFPVHVWGNDNWGDCVLAARANQQQRQQRVETRQTIPITDQMVIDKYKLMTGAVAPGDANDTGLIMLDALKDWRGGWHLPVWDKKGRTYKIDAYGELPAADGDTLRAGCYLLTGIQFGVALPLSAADQVRAGQPWDVVSGPRGTPGSWGGHAIYSCEYDQGGFWVKTWGMRQYMTNAFIETYADEVWAVVQANETSSRYIDVPKLDDYLRSVGAVGINQG